MRKIHKRTLRARSGGVVKVKRYTPGKASKPFTLVVNGKHRHYNELTRMQRDYRFFSRFADCEAWDNFGGYRINDEMPAVAGMVGELCDKSDLDLVHDNREMFNL